MFKRIVIILFIVILFGFGISIRSMSAQKYYADEITVASEDLIFIIEKRLNKILALLERKNSNEEILSKLNRIMETQAQIKEELKGQVASL